MKKIVVLIMCAAICQFSLADNIKGKVYCEGKPMEGVLVSDGVEIVKTDASGRYSIQSAKREGCVFVITPSGYYAHSADGLRPGFWQSLHLPVEQEESHDFELVGEDQSRYRVLFPTDIHLVNDPQRQDIRRFKEMVMPLIRKQVSESEGPVYSFNLGDTTHEIYWYQFNFNEADALRLFQDIEYPGKMYTIMGNHDHDGAIVGEDVDHRAAWMERDCWGPGQYSVNIGGDHWVFLDNIFYINVEGKGKKSPGIKGDRSYESKLTESQLAWLEKDLSLVPADARVRICTHAPILYSKRASGILMPRKQVDRIADMCSRFTHDVDIFSGHIHYFDICDCAAYPRLHQYGLPATSGIMWETPIDWTLTNSDGGEAGVFRGDFASGEAVYDYDSFCSENTAGSVADRYFRFYDMNEVGKAYKASKGVKMQQELFPETRKDYSKAEWKNWVFVNYWFWHPGDMVEILENGRKLEVLHEPYEDPEKNFAYDLQILENPVMHHSNRAKDSCTHLFEAKCRSAKSVVTVRIIAADGQLKYQEEFQRPWVFRPQGPAKL